MNSQRLLGNVVIGILVAIAVVSVVAVISDVAFIFYVRSIISGGLLDEAQARSFDIRQSIIGTFQLMLRITCAIIFLIWVFRSHKNLAQSELGGLQFKSKWTVIYFFIPIVNLFRPYQVMKELWLGSNALYNLRLQNNVGESPSSALIGWWWATFLLAGILASVSGRMMFEAESPSHVLTATGIMCASDLLDIAAAIAAALLVRRITEIQERIGILPANVGIQFVGSNGANAIALPPT